MPFFASMGALSSMVSLHPSASPPDKYISSLRQWYFGLDLERRALRPSQTMVKYVANVIVFGKTRETLNVSHPVTCDRRDEIVTSLGNVPNMFLVYQ